MKGTYWVGMGLVLGLVGCAQLGNPPPEDLVQGLTVLEAKDTSIAAAYKQGDVVVYFEAVRGRPTTEEYRQRPDSPQFEVDARFVADNGVVFFSQQGGDGWIDPSWAEDLTNRDEMAPTAESNEVLFDMAAQAVGTLDLEVAQQIGAAEAVALAPELKALRDFGAAAPATFVAQKERMLERRAIEGLPDVEVEYGSGDPEDAAIGQLGANYYYIAVHDECLTVSLFGACVGGGYHSATRLYSWQGYWLNVHNSCNHGDCANSLDFKCLLQYYDAIEDYKPAWNYHTCLTGYDWASNSSHNCHDDTRVQLADFVYGNGHQKNPGYQYWCSDGDSGTDISSINDQTGSPDCNAGTSKGYDHPRFCRHQTPNAQGYNAAGGCYCDVGCKNRNDCCLDGPYGNYGTTASGCQAENACGGYAANAACWCDSYCSTYGDCCSDGPC